MCNTHLGVLQAAQPGNGARFTHAVETTNEEGATQTLHVLTTPQNKRISAFVTDSIYARPDTHEHVPENTAGSIVLVHEFGHGIGLTHRKAEKETEWQTEHDGTAFLSGMAPHVDMDYAAYKSLYPKGTKLTQFTKQEEVYKLYGINPVDNRYDNIMSYGRVQRADIDLSQAKELFNFQ